MTRLISEILNAPEPAFSHQLEQLELLAGRPGLDIKLTTELGGIFRDKAKQLGLDEADTHGKELYFAMRTLALNHSEELAKLIGVESKDSPEQMITACVKYIEKRLGKRTIWALKSSVLRKQLKDNPPKKIMKIFGIRSIDSALKRERPSIFYCFAPALEPTGWLSKYTAQARQLTNSDFDNQQITISIIAKNRQNQLKKAGLKLNQYVYFDQESAGIEIAVPAKRFDGDVLFIVDSILTRLRTMLRRSAYYKYQGFNPEFFSKLEQVRVSGFNSIESTNHPFDWPTIIHATTEIGVPGILQTQEHLISAEDLLVPHIAQIGKFDFWKHPFGLYRDDNLIVSFNISDMIINAVNNLPATNAYIENARQALRWELFGRYLEHSSVHAKAVDIHSGTQEEIA